MTSCNQSDESENKQVELHPIHLKYLSRNGRGTLDTLFGLFDKLGNMKLLTEALSLTYLHVINPAFSEPVSVHDRQNDLIQEPVSHSRFKVKARELAEHGAEAVLVVGIVHQALCYVLSRANADIEECRAAHQGIIDNAREMLEGELADWERSQTEEVIAMSQKHIATFSQVVADFQVFYVKFCEVVLSGLMEDDRERTKRAIEELRNTNANSELSEEEFPGAPKEMPDA